MKMGECEATANFDTLRAACCGVIPLPGRLEPWMATACRDENLQELIDQFDSPLNLINTDPFIRNIAALQLVASELDVDLGVYFARKANKCLAFVSAAQSQGCGVDVASAQELQQVLDQGQPPGQVICTAAVKSRALLALCVNRGVTMVIDNVDELTHVRQVAQHQPRRAVIALRLSHFHHDGVRLASRFGFSVDDVPKMVAKELDGDKGRQIELTGIHFHLDGYSLQQRVSAIDQSLTIAAELQSLGHAIHFLDIGGGMPMSYLNSSSDWDRFWCELERALRGERDAITYRNHGLGHLVVDGRVVGKRDSYPFYQSPVQASWLCELLRSECNGSSLVSAIRQHKLQLRCEPGRSLLDGCGATVARVEFVKSAPEGYLLAGLAMNHTQCRTSSDDFLVDPLLVPTGVTISSQKRASAEGFLVGAYCTESELLCLRKLQFPHGIASGDTIMFPNTAGYFMHFLESRSHQFPLAKNLDMTRFPNQIARLDLIDTLANSCPPTGRPDSLTNCVGSIEHSLP